MAALLIPAAYDELVEYLAHRADPQEIINFSISEVAQQRAEELLDKNCSNQLTPEERLELAQMLHFDRLMSVLKAKAFARVGRGSEAHP